MTIIININKARSSLASYSVESIAQLHARLVISNRLSKGKEANTSASNIVPTRPCPPCKDFAADFRNTMGRPLPIQDFGYRTLDDFIRNIPDVVKVSPGPNGEKYYYGVATAETQHVARLVATQKKPPARRGVKPSACVRPTGFTKKGLAGPRGFSGSASPRRGQYEAGGEGCNHFLGRRGEFPCIQVNFERELYETIR